MTNPSDISRVVWFLPLIPLECSVISYRRGGSLPLTTRLVLKSDGLSNVSAGTLSSACVCVGCCAMPTSQMALQAKEKAEARQRLVARHGAGG